MAHNTRCNKCKSTIYEFLYRKYGKLEFKHKVEVPVRIDELKEFTSPQVFSQLSKIYKSLCHFRGYQSFVKSRYLQRCDIYIPKLNCIVEIDEVQHFSLARAETLKLYPKFLRIGFDRKKWIHYCMTYKALDPSPEYRDEQRAWYDTLRDFLPLFYDYNQTRRIHIGDYPWCELDTSSKSDLKLFITMFNEF